MLIDHGEIEVQIQDSTTPSGNIELLPARVVIKASDGQHLDGSGYGLYDDGRFFTEGTFTVNAPPGYTEMYIANGPNYMPLRFSINVETGKKISISAHLYRWFSPEERGWYSGDNHVHSQHDRTAKVKTGLAYTALQGKANGLSYITEAGSHVSYDDIDQLSTDTFLLKHAQELGGSCYTGHLNTPGITSPISGEELSNITKRPLPTQAIVQAVHDREGVVIYTHTLTPPHQLHWMAATEVYSDSVLGECAEAFDLDSRATELLWFSILNMGNKVACSSYTDSTLERTHTLTPGDRRVYRNAPEFTYPAIVKAVQQGRTFSTNGGPVYSFFMIDDHAIGDVITVGDDQTFTARVEIKSLYPLKKAELYRRGNVVKEFDVVGQGGTVLLEHTFQETRKSWYVLKVEDDRGNWCITSPIYFETPHEEPRSTSSAILLEISNHARFVHLSHNFYAHLIVTVSPDDCLSAVQFLKDGEDIQTFVPSMNDSLDTEKIPVTEMDKDCPYGLGWIWYPHNENQVHFQADVPVTEGGWYSVRVKTAGGMTIQSDAVYFDSANPNSQELSTVWLSSDDAQFRLWGYGEEMPLAEIRAPFEDRWWYPNRSAWRLKVALEGQVYELYGDHPYDPSVTSASIHPTLSNLFKSSAEVTR